MRKPLAMLFAMTVFLTACGGSSGRTTTTLNGATQKLSIVVTTTQLADWVHTLAANNVSVYTILKPGVNPHTYKLTSSDINAIATADLVIKNGAGLEPWFDSAIGSIDHSGQIIDASNDVTIRPSADPNATLGDPHIWMSVANAKLMVANIGKALEADDPADKSQYDATERAYDAQLDALTNTTSQELGALTNKFLVTDHESFDYFCDEFNLQCLGAATPISGSANPPTPEQIQSVANALKAENVTAVFTTDNGPPTTAEQLAVDLGVKVEEGTNSLYADSLGPTGSDSDTYIKMITHDVNAIVAGLH